MPPVDLQTRREFRRRAAVCAFVVLLLVVCVFGLEFARDHANPEPSNEPIQTSNSGPATNLAAPPATAAPGTAVSAETVLDKLDKWHADHPIYHSLLTTTYPNGSVISKMEVFSYTNETDGMVVKFKSQVLAYTPSLEFQGVRRNGKLEVYFPRSHRLIEPDGTGDLYFMPDMPGNFSSAKDLLKIARSSFAEASEDMEVATLAVRSETFKVPYKLTGDVFLSFRINTDGKLLGIEEQAQGQRITSSMKYLSFDSATVSADSPVMPAGLTGQTNETLMKALQEEVQNITPQPLHKKT